MSSSSKLTDGIDDSSNHVEVSMSLNKLNGSKVSDISMDFVDIFYDKQHE